MPYAGTDRRARPKPLMLIATILAVTALAFGPIFLMAQTSLDRALVFFICMPLSGLSYAWLWRERRQKILRWATLAFGGSVLIWVAVFFLFIFGRQSESQGMVLVIASLAINFVLFLLLDKTWKRRRMRTAIPPEIPVL